MARIVVADDNSNIQKMVGLALKDQGIDVVAVGNGEAAVRKISDIHPDLVLADVFMPVRNGYEVCQYVKQDPALAHIPVILLVGAFDPLDEQEAQRVGADGVLKKPFVPPDPLIAMVKAALARAGVSLSTDKGEKAGKGGERKVAEIPAPKQVPAAAPIPVPMSVVPAAISIEETEGLVEEVALKPAAVTMEGGAPLAFGNLMGSTTEDDPRFMPPVHSELAVERDWRAKEDEEEVDVAEEDEEEPAKGSWRRDAEEITEPAGLGRAVSDWRDTVFSEPAARKEISGATLPEQPAMATNRVAATQPAAAFSEDAWAAAIAAGTNGNAGTREETAAAARVLSGNGAELVSEVAVERPVAPRDEVLAAPRADDGSPSTAARREVEHEAVSTAIDRFAVTRDGQEEKSDPMASGAWEVQAHKANLLAATWDAQPLNAAPAAVAAVQPVVENVPAASAEQLEEPAADEGELAGNGAAGAEVTMHPEIFEEHAGSALEPVVESETSAYAVMDEAAAKEETAPTLEMASPYITAAVLVEPAGAAESKQEETLFAATAANGTSPAANGAGDTVNDDVVARVLANLSPEVLQAVTRQILKPVVEAMVREELNKKQ